MNIQFASLRGPKVSLGRADVAAKLDSVGILCESTSFFKPRCTGARGGTEISECAVSCIEPLIMCESCFFWL